MVVQITRLYSQVRWWGHFVLAWCHVLDYLVVAILRQVILGCKIQKVRNFARLRGKKTYATK